MCAIRYIFITNNTVMEHLSMTVLLAGIALFMQKSDHNLTMDNDSTNKGILKLVWYVGISILKIWTVLMGVGSMTLKYFLQQECIQISCAMKKKISTHLHLVPGICPFGMNNFQAHKPQ